MNNLKGNPVPCYFALSMLLAVQMHAIDTFGGGLTLITCIGWQTLP